MKRIAQPIFYFKFYVFVLWSVKAYIHEYQNKFVVVSRSSNCPVLFTWVYTYWEDFFKEDFFREHFLENISLAKTSLEKISFETIYFERIPFERISSKSISFERISSKRIFLKRFLLNIFSPRFSRPRYSRVNLSINFDKNVRFVKSIIFHFDRKKKLAKKTSLDDPM